MFTNFIGLLTVLFIGLKLGHVIDWSWWWVWSPMWGFFGVIFVLAFIKVFLDEMGRKR